MKFKGYILSAMALVMAGMTFAAEPEFHQFTRDDFNVYNKSENGETQISGQQGWIPANMITLKVTAGSTVYLTSKVRSWYEPTDLANMPDGNGYDMSANKYGYIIADVKNGTVSPTGDIHLADGTPKDITYQNPTGPQTLTIPGYLLGTFENDAEIFFAMTPTGYDEIVTSSPYVNDPDSDLHVNSILASRQINYDDQAGNVVVNFGTTDGVGHEFVIGYIGEPPKPPVAGGQPLPGVLLAGLLSLGSVTACKKMKKRN